MNTDIKVTDKTAQLIDIAKRLNDIENELIAFFGDSETADGDTDMMVSAFSSADDFVLNLIANNSTQSLIWSKYKEM